jgi:NAD(P)-dependent dehydrogenase (short-subunit alcohol dehydrogenase family)
MARVFITGSSTGLGLMAGQLLIEQGHEVVLHGRTRDRVDDARRVCCTEGVVGIWGWLG